MHIVRKYGFFVLTLLAMVAGIPVGVWTLQTGQNLYIGASGEKASIEVHLKNVTPTRDHWRNLAQGGEEPGNQLGSVMQEVQALEPEYIRLDHIYDFFDVVSVSGGSVNYDWSRLDKAVDAITQMGATPFLSLSYMPTVFTGGTEVDKPNDWTDWRNLVRATIEHYSGRNGKNINNVYYEVWNEPDLFGEFKLYGEKNYLEMYRQASIGASGAGNVNEFKIGGPATTALYPNWYHGFISFVNDNDLRLDFYSWHKYSEDVNAFSEDIAKLNAWVNELPPMYPIEMVITESGFSSENDVAYDMRVGAIHALALVAELKGGVNKIFHFEIKDGAGPEQFWGRWGLLTHEVFGTPLKKDRYKALEFLQRMSGGQRIAADGDGSFVKVMAREVGSRPRILVVNYDKNNRHFETVPMKIFGVPDRFIWRRTDFLGGTSERFVQPETSVWETSELFEPNTAAIFEVVE